MAKGRKAHADWRKIVDDVPLKVQVVDTVGAGDTFQAALLAWLDENGRLSARGLAELSADRIADLLTFATHAAAITCSRRGADLPYRSEME